MTLLHIITYQTTRGHIPEDTNRHFLTCFLFEHKCGNADTETKHSGVIQLPYLAALNPRLTKLRLLTDSSTIRAICSLRFKYSLTHLKLSQSLRVEQIPSDVNLSNGMNQSSANWKCRYQPSDVTICKSPPEGSHLNGPKLPTEQRSATYTNRMTVRPDPRTASIVLKGQSWQ